MKKLSKVIARTVFCVAIAVAVFSAFSLKPEAAYASMGNTLLEPTKKESQDFLLVSVDAPGHPSYYASGNLYTALATGEDTDGQFALMDFFVPPLEEDATPPHIHSRESESFYILEGELTVLMGDKSVVATPGTFVYLPKGRTHRFTNLGTKPVRTLSLLTPAGFEKVFREVGYPVTDKSAPPPPFTPADFEKYMAISHKYGITIVGKGLGAPKELHLEGEKPQDYLLVPPDADRPSFQMSESLNTVLATGQETGGVFALIDSVVPSQAAPPLQINDRKAESLFMLEGELTVQTDNQTTIATPGTFVHLLKDIRYEVKNLGTTAARTLVIATPGGVEEYLAEVGQPVTDKTALSLPRPGLETITQSGLGALANR